MLKSKCTLLARIFTKALLYLFLALSLPFLPCTAFGDQQSVSIGYGLGTLNGSSSIGQLSSGDNYDFAEITYGYEKTLSGKFNFLVEPFVAIINRPTSGVDVGCALGGRYYFGPKNHRGFFTSVSGGGAYTSVKFEDQGTHGVFVLQGGVGYKWEQLFVEGRFRHYSNAGLASPNRSINATVVSVGYAF